MKPEPSDSLNLAIVAAILVGNLPAEEVVEEVLEVALSLTLLLIVVSAVVVVGILRVAAGYAMVRRLRRPLFVDCLGRVWVLMLTTAGPTCLAIFTNSLGGIGGVDHLQGSGVGAVVLLFLSADSVREQRSRPQWRRKAWQAKQKLKRDGASAAVQKAIS